MIGCGLCRIYKKRFVFCDLKKLSEFCYPYHPFNEVKKMSNKKVFIYNKFNKYTGEYNFVR